jgi:hypothetical protein
VYYLNPDEANIVVHKDERKGYRVLAPSYKSLLTRMGKLNPEFQQDDSTVNDTERTRVASPDQLRERFEWARENANPNEQIALIIGDNIGKVQYAVARRLVDIELGKRTIFYVAKKNHLRGQEEREIEIQPPVPGLPGLRLGRLEELRSGRH